MATGLVRITPETKYPPFSGWYMKNHRDARKILDEGGSFYLGSKWSGAPLITSMKLYRYHLWRALDRRINAKAGLEAPRGRKDCPNWINALHRLCGMMNGTRVIVRPGDVPLEYHGRLKHRITWPWEE